jgi:hypothetical protein
MKKIRTQALTPIAYGRFEVYVASLLSPTDASKYLDLDRLYSIIMDEDEANAMLRQELYERKRGILLNLAEAEKGKVLLPDGVVTHRRLENTLTDIYFDLRRTYTQEYLPDTVAKTIRFACLAQRKSLDMLPQLVKVSRVDAELRVRVTNRPRMLRSVIGDRRCMEQHGQAIIKGLLQAFFGLQQGGIACRNI